MAAATGPHSVTIVQQIWNPDDWEQFAFSLLQSRHGPLNVHKIPSEHKGDLGIDYYCIRDAVAYQCYSVEEPIDILTRANRQQNKITRDLKKLIDNHSEVHKLFVSKPVKHWLLLVPRHDSKDVNLHCAKKTAELRATNCPALDHDFEVSIQDPTAFPTWATKAAANSVSHLQLSIPEPSEEELENWVASSNELLANATRKLSKKVGPQSVDDAVAEAVKYFLTAERLLDALRNGAPDLHESIVAAINTRVRRLTFAGPSCEANANAVIGAEVDLLIASLQKAAPNLSDENTQEIAFGKISDWILRCPLDFPNAQ
ncbi:hypothetical protein DYI24_13395 [Rhodopseudomonas sp. BR0C11]|nr:hypothetical protein [Rhodopseudomonas sp. BR0C11]